MSMKQVLKVHFFTVALFISIGNSHPFPSNPTETVDNELIDLSPYGDQIYGQPDEKVGKLLSEMNPNEQANPEEMGSYYEGDILIPGIAPRNILTRQSSRWPNAVVPYTFTSTLSSTERNMILRAIAEFHSRTCIRFVQRSNQADFIRFANGASGCWSSVGRIGGGQVVNLQSGGCFRLIGTTIHEIMHALGFLHEQSRHDRDDFVQILTENIQPDAMRNFNRANVRDASPHGVAYDTGSVLHYSSHAFSRNGRPTIAGRRLVNTSNMGQRNGFARGDVQKINSMYNRCNSHF